MRVLVGVQARTWSTRLPKKIYEMIGSKSLLQWVHGSCLEAAQLLLKTSKSAIFPRVAILGPDKDARLADYCEEMGMALCQGSETDLYQRYQAGLETFGCNHLVRVTSDCWNLHPQRIVDVIEALKEVDYASNTLIRTYPEGQDVQGATKEAFSWIGALAREREHVFYEFEHNLFQRQAYQRHGLTFEAVTDRESLILQHNSIDTLEDLERARKEQASREGRKTIRPRRNKQALLVH